MAEEANANNIEPARNYSDPTNQILDLLCRLHYRMHNLRTQVQVIQVEVKGIKRKLSAMESGSAQNDPDESDGGPNVEDALNAGQVNPESEALSTTEKMPEREDYRM